MTRDLYLMGYGKVGKAFVEGLRLSRPGLLSDRGLDLRLKGVATSKLMAFDPKGLEAASLGGCLAGGEASRASAFVDRLLDQGGRGSILIDCTASAEVAALYEGLLREGVSVVTANKIADSGSQASWSALRAAAKSGKAAYRHEATVGAGLPILGSIQDLVATGDEILHIEAVLSGTISHIFNHLGAEAPLSLLVKEAMARGYTEPDPRIDLSALDAARKVLILAREAGMRLEPGEVAVEALLSPASLSAPDVPSFLEGLVAEDAGFEARRKEAERQGAVLRHVALIGSGKASLGLGSVPLGQPLAALRGNDNIVAISSARYAERPLVVQGPGAGPEVTASGLLADLLRVAESAPAGPGRSSTSER
jgi:bifunctional aspartokinase / homoserine dehydrogenase 1